MFLKSRAAPFSFKSLRTLSSTFPPSHTQNRSTLAPLRPLTFAPVRTYYGHITDHKMAPQLEPYFKKCDGNSHVHVQALMSLGSMNWPTHSLSVSKEARFDTISGGVVTYIFNRTAQSRRHPLRVCR